MVRISWAYNCPDTSDLEVRVVAWKDNVPNMEVQVQELLRAASRPGATPEIGTAHAWAKNHLDQNKFLSIKAQETLNCKHTQAQNQMAQAHAQVQEAAWMTST